MEIIEIKKVVTSVVLLIAILLIAGKTTLAVEQENIVNTIPQQVIALKDSKLTANAEIGLNDFQISNMDYYYVTESAVAYNSTNNEYLVVWVGRDNSAGSGEQEIFMQRLDAATGTEVGGNDIRVSDMGPDGNTNYYAANPAVVYNKTANEYLVLWVGTDVGIGEWDVYGQRISGTTGAEIGSNDFRISDMGPDGNANYIAGWVAAAHNTSTNEYLVVWTGDDNTSPLVDDEWEIFGQRLNASGVEIGTNDFRISDMGPDGSAAYQVETLDIVYNSTNNEYLVVWESDDNTGSLVDNEREVFGQRLNASGAEIGSNDFRISDMGSDGDANYDARRPEVAYNKINDEYLVIWQGDDDRFLLANNEFEVFGQRLNAITGAELGLNDFRISDMGPDGNSSYDAYKPEIAYNSTSNEYLVVWTGDDNTAPLVDDEYEIFGQRLKIDGAEIGSNDFRISDMGPDSDPDFGIFRYTSLAYNNTNDEYLVTWDADDSVDGEYEIFGQRLSTDNNVFLPVILNNYQ